jgi:hypothetical protein
LSPSIAVVFHVCFPSGFVTACISIHHGSCPRLAMTRVHIIRQYKLELDRFRIHLRWTTSHEASHRNNRRLSSDFARCVPSIDCIEQFHEFVHEFVRHGNADHAVGSILDTWVMVKLELVCWAHHRLG